MSSALTDALLKGTTDAAHGGFTVDVEKARSKFERFRLENPLLYTVELVQAAVLSGATRIDIAVDADDFSLRFTAKRPIRRKDLEDLESAILVRQKDGHPARLQLALAVSAAQALNPSRIVVTADGVCLTIVDEVATMTDAPASSEVAFALRESVRVGHVLEFLKGLVGRTDEERLLRDRCRHAACEVFVNGTRVSGQSWPGAPHVDVIGQRVRGAVGFLADPHGASRLILLRAGVIQEELLWAEVAASAPPTGMFAVVDGDDLARDASFTRFVRNDAFKSLVQSLERHVEECARHLEAGILADEPLALERAAAMARVLGRRVVKQGKGAGAAAVLAEARLLRDPAGRPLSLARIHKAAGKTGVVRTHTGRDLIDREVLDDDVVVHVRDDADSQLIAAMGWTVADFAPEASRRLERRTHYQNFLTRRAEQRPDSDFLRRQTITQGEVTIDVGLRTAGPADLELCVNVDGCRLARLQRPFPIPGLSITLTGPFSPAAMYDDVVRDARFGSALRRATQALPSMLDGPYPRAVEGNRRLKDALLPLLALTLNGSVLWRAARDAFNAPVENAGESFSLLVVDGPKAHQLVTVPMIPRFPQGAFSLAALRKDDEPLGFVPPETPTFRMPLADVVIAGDTLVAVLKKTIPDRPLVSLKTEADQVARRRRVLERSPTTRQSEGVVVPIDDAFEVGGENYRRVGSVGFAASATKASTRLRLLFRGRLLQDTDVSGPLPGLTAVIDDESVMLDADLNVSDVRPLAARAEAAVPALMERLVSVRDPARWSLARRLVAMAFPTRSAHAAWRQVVSTGSAGAKEWRSILEFAERVKPEEFERALLGLLPKNAPNDAPKPPNPKDAATSPRPSTGKSVTRVSLKALSHLASATRAATGTTAFLGDIVEIGLVTGLLETFKLGGLAVECLDMRQVPLRDLISGRTSGAVRTVSAAGTAPPGFEDAILVTEDILAVLVGLGIAVTDADEDLAAARARQAFEASSTSTATLAATLTTVLRRPVDEPGIKGECALLAGPPTLNPTATIEVLHRGRRLDIIDIGTTIGVSMAAIVDVEDIHPNATFTGIVADKRREALLDVLADRARHLVEEVANAPGMRLSEPGRARLLEYMSRERRRPVEVKLAARLMGLDLYRDVGGRPVGLEGFSKQRPMRIMTQPPSPPTPSGFDDVVVVASPMERHVLERIKPTLIADSAWQAAVETSKRRSQLVPFPTRPAGASAFERETAIGEIRLRLAVPTIGSPPRLWVGAEGLVVEMVMWSNPLPVVGFVEGASAVTADWREAKLTPKLTASIAREVVAMWTAFAHAIDLEEDPKLRDILTNTALRLAATEASSMASDALALRGQLKRMPLLQADSGGFISIDDAVERRPTELLPLLVRHGLLHKDVLRPPPAPPAPSPADPPPSTKSSRLPLRGVSPTPEPVPPPITDAVVLRERITDEIRLIRRDPRHLLLDVEIERIHVIEGRGKSVVVVGRGEVTVDIKHPLAAAALQSPAALIILVIAVVSALNTLLESFDDDEERTLLLGLARHLGAGRRTNDRA